MRVLLIITLLLGILNAQNREALLIGNSNYKYISTLNDTSSNLSRLKTTLEKLGFTVKIKNDLTAKRLKQAIDNFRDRLARNRDTIGFFYYSGHGCQMDNVGYLIPTNVNSSKRLDVQYDALNINKMLATLQEAGNRVNMLFLDACRDNTPTGSKGGKKGLAQAPLTPKGTLVVYATEATKTADDNSNFVNALIAQIKKPNQSIRDIGFNISDDVASQTREHQVPQVFAQRIPNMVLKSSGGGHPIEPTPTPQPITTSKWLKPSDGVCRANSGKLYKGVCLANWKNAKKICSASGGQLPSRDDLKKVVVDCGGSFVTYGNKDWDSLTNKNIANKSYKACYKEKGFSSWYWTREEEDSSFAWFVNFKNGYDNWLPKTGIGYVLCVSGQ